MTPERRQKILISPLNWGYGHAGRMIPVAKHLQSLGHEVIFGIDRSLYPLIMNELPGVEITLLPGIRMRYSRIIPQYIMILLQTPALIFCSLREHSLLKKIIAEKKPDIVISDNRFGLFSRKAFCVYVTHMIRIPYPRLFRMFEYTGILLHRIIISRFDMCLIPDRQGDINLAGRLSHAGRPGPSYVYTGWLSRFTQYGTSSFEPELYICLFLSGPEPQRSLLLRKVKKAASASGKKLVVLSGTEVKDENDDPSVSYIINSPTPVMREVLLKAGTIICRSGYTSLMELASLSKGAIIVPTPGQTEQEYLGLYNNGRWGFTLVKQNEIEYYNFEQTQPGHRIMAAEPETSAELHNAIIKVLQENEKRGHH